MPKEPVEYPASCEPGSEPDRYAIWSELRDLWCAEHAEDGKPAPYSDLAEHIGAQRQHEAQWASGKGGRSPAPWYRIHQILFELDLAIVIHHEGWAIIKRPEGI